MVQASKIFNVVFAALAISQVAADDKCCTQDNNNCVSPLVVAIFSNGVYTCCPGGDVVNQPTGNEAKCPAPVTTTTTTTTTTSVAPSPSTSPSPADCCLASQTGSCPTGFNSKGNINTDRLCCQSNNISTQNIKQCPGSNPFSPTKKTVLGALGCCFTPSTAPVCIKGTALTNNFIDNSAVCCVDVNEVSATTGITPQCADAVVQNTENNSATGVTFSASMVGAAIVAAQMF